MKKLSLIIIIVAAIPILFLLKDKKSIVVENTNIEQIATSTPQSSPTISISPSTILPGDPVLISVDATSTEITFNGKQIPIFKYNEKYNALTAVDVNDKNTSYKVTVKLIDGSTITDTVVITPREKIEAPLGIPEKLGGNTIEAQNKLLANLAKENSVLNNIISSTTILWDKPFTYPLKDIFITDDYGYDRLTVNSTIVHKGTDFRAKEGTQVSAMNDGIVKLARQFTVYGNSVIIDHGLGVQTLYMHLSKLNVKEGDIVNRGQIIGESGSTGYAESPHLHISIKIGGISIDPITFITLFK